MTKKRYIQNFLENLKIKEFLGWCEQWSSFTSISIYQDARGTSDIYQRVTGIGRTGNGGLKNDGLEFGGLEMMQ